MNRILTSKRYLVVFAGQVILLLVCILGVVGCDNTIEPFGEDSGGFSIYGYLSVSDRIQFVRVKDLRTPLISDSTRELDATVTLENRDTGETERLRDSVVVFNDIYTHNFYTTTSIRPATEYRVVVEGEDGRNTEATATTPELTKTDVRPTTGHCKTTFRVSFRNVPSVAHVEVKIGFTLDGEKVWVPWSVSGTSSDSPLLSFEAAQVVDRRVDRNVADRFLCTFLDERQWYIAYLHLGPDWPFDQGDDPLESVSVNGGLGSFGGLYRDTLSTIKVDTTIAPPL